MASAMRAGFTQDDGRIFCTEDLNPGRGHRLTTLPQKPAATSTDDIIYKLRRGLRSASAPKRVGTRLKLRWPRASRLSGCDFTYLPGRRRSDGPKIEYTLEGRARA